MLRTDTERWLCSSQFKKEWESRSQSLLDMLSGVTLGRDMRAIEFGCGPHQPFRSVASGSDLTVECFDIKEWDDSVGLIDLNTHVGKLPDGDIAIFSGVMEYLNDVPFVLAQCASTYRYLGVSYAVLPSGLSDLQHIRQLRQRILSNGWRNHYTIGDFCSILQNGFFMTDLQVWKDQCLFIAEVKGS